MNGLFRKLAHLEEQLGPDSFRALIASGNTGKVKEFIAALIAEMWHAISYDQSVGLVPLIERAVGERNLGDISRDITPERFPLKGTGVRMLKARVEPYLDNETSEQAAVRLTAAGHVLASTGDLAAFLHDHPGEVEKWAWVLAISEDSRWSDPDGLVYVPYVVVDGAYRYFNLHVLRRQLGSDYGVLVICE